jgi:hypothetical protein
MKAPKYKEGQFVYSYQNPTEKRQINKVRKATTEGFSHAYRLTLVNAAGYAKNSNFIDEKSISLKKIK